MMYKIRWLWRQFTGPIITAIAVGIYRTVSSIDKIASYINSISIDTCKDAHATLISMCMGISRPFIHVAPEGFMFFTSHPTENEDYGFSNVEDQTVGGLFGDLYNPGSMPGQYVTPFAIWIKIMKATRDTDAEPGSIVWFDAILAAITMAGVSPYSAYSWYTRRDFSHAIGDLKIYMGENRIYGSAYITDTSMFRELANQLIYPDKKIEIINTTYGHTETIFIGEEKKWAYGAMSCFLGRYGNYGWWEAQTVISAIPTILDNLFTTKTNHVTSSRLDLRNIDSMVLCTWETKVYDHEEVGLGELVQIRGQDGELIIGEEMSFDSETQYVQGDIHMSPLYLADPASKAYSITNTKWGICYVIGKEEIIPSASFTGIELYWDAVNKVSYLRAIGHTEPIYSITFTDPEEDENG